MILKQLNCEISEPEFSSINRSYNYTIVSIDWNKLSLKKRVEILEAMGNGDESPHLANDKCSMRLVIPRSKTGYLDFGKCYLHISTIVTFSPEEEIAFIKKRLNNRIEEFGFHTILNSREIISIMSKILPTIDLKEVI